MKVKYITATSVERLELQVNKFFQTEEGKMFNWVLKGPVMEIRLDQGLVVQTICYEGNHDET